MHTAFGCCVPFILVYNFTVKSRISNTLSSFVAPLEISMARNQNVSGSDFKLKKKNIS